MSRTPGQVAADEQLTAAIEAVDRAYTGGGGDVVGDYIVLAAWQRLGDDGEITHPTSMIPRGTGVAPYRMRGLLADAWAYLNSAGTVMALLEASGE